MRITRIDIEGRTGKATIFRSGGEILINISRRTEAGDTTIRRGIGRNDSWVVSAISQWEQKDAAEKLQIALDGQRGCSLDIADYLRAIETFAD